MAQKSMVSRSGANEKSGEAKNSRALYRVAMSALVVAWLFAVIISYYLVHKPLSIASLTALPDTLGNILGSDAAEVFSALANVLGDVATFVVVVIFAGAAGHRLLRRWQFESALEALVLWTGVGLGALGFLVFVLAVIGIVNQWVYWIGLGVGIVSLRREVRAIWNNVHSVQMPHTTRVESALALFCALTLGITFLFSLTPPWGWDGLQYHLVTPKLILENGRVAPPPDNLSLNNPNLVEMLFLLGMTLKGDGATQVLHWIFFPLTLGAILVFAQKYFSMRGGWLASVLYCAVPTAALLSTWAYNDHALTFYTFTAFAIALRARETRATRDFVLVGVLCGFAFGEKVTAFFVPLALAVLLFRPQRETLYKIILMIVVAGALAAPWWLRNLVFVGNPVYPFVFGGKDWDAFRTVWYTRFGSGLLQRPFELLIVPWTMTIYGTQSDLFQGTLGPLLLALLPLNLIPIYPKNNPARAMWFFAAVLFFVWLLGVAQSNLLWQSRLLLPAFPIFSLLAARGLEKLNALTLPQFSIHRFTSMVVAIVIALTASSYALAFANDQALGYFFGAVSREKYLTGILGAHYTTAQWVNEKLPREARILFLWEPRTYYFERDAQADAILDRFAHLRFLYGDAKSIADELRAEGYTHVLLYREGLDNLLHTGYDPITTNDVETLRALVTNDLMPVYGVSDLGLETREGKFGLTNVREEPYTLYQIKSR